MKKYGQLIFMMGCVLLCWQSLVMFFDLPTFILPTPWQILQTLAAQHQLILEQTTPTVIETLLGFGLGILIGCFTAFIMTWFRNSSRWFFPLLIVSQAIPTFAIAPLIVLWLGYGLASKIATATLMIFFPITSACYDGLRNTPAGWLDLAATMNATKKELFFRIRLPAALPTLASGIRIAAVAAPIGAIIGEWVGASRGLGYLMLNANARMEIDLMFAALLVIMLMALILYFSVDQLLRKLIWWH